MPTGSTRWRSWTCAFPGRSETSLVPRTVARTGSAVAAEGQRSRREMKPTRSSEDLGRFTDDPPRETGRHQSPMGALARSAPATGVVTRSRRRFIARNAETVGSFHPASIRAAVLALLGKMFPTDRERGHARVQVRVERRLVRHGTNHDVESGQRSIPRW